VLNNHAETLTLKLQDIITAARLDLSEAESQELEELLTEYRDIFEMKSSDCGRINSIYQAEVGKKLKNGGSGSETAPKSSPVVLFRKKNADLPFCLKCRQLNVVTRDKGLTALWLEPNNSRLWT
jgi:hypothetical protein